MSDATIQQRAEQMLAMISAEDKQAISQKLARPGKETPSMLAVAAALARYETKTGERTAKIKLVRAMIKIGQQPQGV